MQHTLRKPSLAPPSQALLGPLGQLETPASGNQNPAHNIHQPDKQCQKTITLFGYGQQNRFNVEFDKDSRNRVFGYGVRVLGDCILVGKDSIFAPPVVEWRVVVCVV